jgi:hypothetical protein
VLLRSKSGAAELLATIYRTEQAAVEAGRYWQAASPCNESAEVIHFDVPLAGAPIPTAKDLFSNEGK